MPGGKHMMQENISRNKTGKCLFTPFKLMKIPI